MFVCSDCPFSASKLNIVAEASLSTDCCDATTSNLIKWFIRIQNFGM